MTIAKPNSRHSIISESDGKKLINELEKIGLPPREAMYWEKTSDGQIKCLLCPKFCILSNYERGQCRARISLGNRLATLVYGKPCSVAIDPIEKKPVFHMLPGTTSFSIATAGCVLGCRYCQNWQISQAKPEEVDIIDLAPEMVVKAAMESGCKSIAYTYTEPTIFYEYMLDTAKLAKKAGIKNIVISCGYINKEPLQQLIPNIDIMKVDLKGFNDTFYRTVTGGDLKGVLQTIELLVKSQVLTELVTLIVPTLNDNDHEMRRMAKWVVETLNPDVPMFLSRFMPTFKLKNLSPTPVPTMERLMAICQETGVNYVYLGNVLGHAGENTYCTKCKRIVVGRIGFSITENNILNGRCKFCDTILPGIWE